jgi:hypothetical protein
LHTPANCRADDLVLPKTAFLTLPIALRFIVRRYSLLSTRRGIGSEGIACGGERSGSLGCSGPDRAVVVRVVLGSDATMTAINAPMARRGTRI